MENNPMKYPGVASWQLTDKMLPRKKERYTQITLSYAPRGYDKYPTFFWLPEIESKRSLVSDRLKKLASSSGKILLINTAFHARNYVQNYILSSSACCMFRSQFSI